MMIKSYRMPQNSDST